MKLGTDYYQNMMPRAMPAVLAGSALQESREAGSLVQRVLVAGGPGARAETLEGANR